MLRFSKVLVHFDESGEYLPSPRVLKPSDVNSTSFVLDSAAFRAVSHFNQMPSVNIRRQIRTNLDLDPWNEDGDPPSVLFSIVNFVIQVGYNGLEIHGFESPNLVMGGRYREPYRNADPNNTLIKAKALLYKDDDSLWKRGFEHLKRQSIELQS